MVQQMLLHAHLIGFVQHLSQSVPDPGWRGTSSMTQLRYADDDENKQSFSSAGRRINCTADRHVIVNDL